MLDIAFKNIMRQRMRAFLTILGIIIGIAAIVALGSVSEGMNVMMQKNLEIIAGRIIVFEGEDAEGITGMMTGFMSSEITDEHIAILKDVSGVKDVVPLIMYMGGSSGGMFGVDWQGIGIEPSKIEYFVGENIEMYDGRTLEEGDMYSCIIGKDVADRYELVLGDYFTIYDEDFEIIGIIEKSDVQDIDAGVIVPIEDMMDLLETDTYQMAYVIPEDITEVELVAEWVGDADDDLYAISSKDIARQASQIIGQISIFTIGIGSIAAFVGGLGVMNTMIMAVMERRKEIGVMKAIGATRGAILKQFLTESAMMSLVGGILGIGLGLMGSFLLTVIAGGMIQMVVSPSLAIGALMFALILGLIGGMYPSWKASQLDPVDALRYE